MAQVLYEHICDSFKAEISSDSLEIVYDGRSAVAPGHDLRRSLSERVAECDLVIACCFSRWREADFFKNEIEVAVAKSVPIVPVIVLASDEQESDLQLGDLHRSFEDRTGRLAQVAVTLRIKSTDRRSVSRALKALGWTLGGDLIREIRTQVIDKARRDLTMFDRSDEVLDDIARGGSGFLNAFMYDGGNTIRRLAANRDFLDWLRGRRERFRLKFLYVDTSFRSFVADTSEFSSCGGLDAIDERFYSPLYEALIRKSGMVHNESPWGHQADVDKSKHLLSELSREYGFIFEARKTSLLPFYRMIVTRSYVYYTHFLPTFSTSGDALPVSPEYHSLRLSAQSPAGYALAKYYDRLWSGASPG